MKILGLSGSTRSASTNTALLRALAMEAPEGIQFSLLEGLQQLPIFNTELEGAATPEPVSRLCEQISSASVLIIASPEYVRAIPGGLKNAIDWLVSREEIVHKPIALVHASHRGDDMLESLRIVLSTVSTQFMAEPFLRIPLMGCSTSGVADRLSHVDTRRDMDVFFATLSAQLRQLAN